GQRLVRLAAAEGEAARDVEPLDRDLGAARGRGGHAADDEIAVADARPRLEGERATDRAVAERERVVAGAEIDRERAAEDVLVRGDDVVAVAGLDAYGSRDH